MSVKLVGLLLRKVWVLLWVLLIIIGMLVDCVGVFG